MNRFQNAGPKPESAATVDVLAVMGSVAERLTHRQPMQKSIKARHGERLTEARDAVAELIAMAEIANESLNAHGIGLSRGDGLTLAAAIARCNGGAA